MQAEIQSPRECYIPRLSWEELNSMTLQVVMQGNDGIVLASDTCGTEIQEDLRSNYDVQKITSVADRGFSYAPSGDRCSLLVGDRIVKESRAGRVISAEMLREIASKVYEEQSQALGSQWQKEVNRKLLLVQYHIPMIWRVDIKSESTAETVIGQATAGDGGNAARFLIQRYFRQNLPVEKLKLLAAHFILMGGHLNTAMVKGLEMAVYANQKEHRVNEEEIQRLTEKSKKIDAIFKELFSD